MEGLALVALGAIPEGLAAHLAERVSELTARSCSVLDGEVDPSPAFHKGRHQYDCRELLPLLETIAEDRGLRVLGIADVDLFSPVFTYVLGEARVGGSAGVFSLFRLRSSFFGLPHDSVLLVERATREALHEVGHLLGLLHCQNPECVMRFSPGAEEVDLKPARYCPECHDRIRTDGLSSPERR